MEQETPAYVPYPKPKRQKKLPLWVKLLTWFFVAIVVVICGSIITFNFMFEYHNVLEQSMSPTINVDGDTDGVYLTKYLKPNRGNIIVARNFEDRLVIKRLIAFGGEKVAVYEDGTNYKLMIIKNGETEATEFDYSFVGGVTVNLKINLETAHANKTFEIIDGHKFLVIPENCFFFLGDNMSSTGSSVDCADYGPIPNDNLVGKVCFIIYGRTDHLKQILEQIF